MGTSKNTPRKPNIVPVGSSKSHKGNSTPKAKKPRSTPRYLEVKIRITTEDYTRGLPYFREAKYITRYVLDAYLEKINRSEANDKTARMRILTGNVDILEPVLKEMYIQGRLNFLSQNQGGDNG